MCTLNDWGGDCGGSHEPLDSGDASGGLSRQIRHRCRNDSSVSSPNTCDAYRVLVGLSPRPFSEIRAQTRLGLLLRRVSVVDSLDLRSHCARAILDAALIAQAHLFGALIAARCRRERTVAAVPVAEELHAGEAALLIAVERVERVDSCRHAGGDGDGEAEGCKSCLGEEAVEVAHDVRRATRSDAVAAKVGHALLVSAHSLAATGRHEGVGEEPEKGDYCGGLPALDARAPPSRSR